MADGKVSVPFDHFLGYERGPHGELVVNEEQARIVRLIYEWFLEGLTPHAIAKKLTDMGIPTPRHGTKWWQGTVRSILTNEKYKGDALMQKYYTEDFLTKKQVLNQGVLPQYYVEGNHEAIIPPETFELVQQELERRKTQKNRYSGVDIFASRIVCGQCGAYYGSKIWHSNSASYRRVVFRCNRKYNEHSRNPVGKGKLCESPHLYEEEIQSMFIKAINQLLAHKQNIISSLERICDELCETSTMEAEKAELNQEMVLISDRVNQMIAENARVAQNQDEYTVSFNELSERFKHMKEKRDAIEQSIADTLSKRSMFQAFMATLKAQKEMVTEFEPTLWGILLDHVTVFTKEDVRFTFRDGTEIRI